MPLTFAMTIITRILGVIGIPPWLAGLVACGVALGGAFWAGHHVAAQACDAASVRAERDTLKRDLAAIVAADQVEAMLNKDIEAERQNLAEQVKDYEVKLKTRPPRKCTLDADDLRAVDGVRGKRKR